MRATNCTVCVRLRIALVWKYAFLLLNLFSTISIGVPFGCVATQKSSTRLALSGNLCACPVRRGHVKVNNLIKHTKKLNLKKKKTKSKSLYCGERKRRRVCLNERTSILRVHMHESIAFITRWLHLRIYYYLPIKFYVS